MTAAEFAALLPDAKQRGEWWDCLCPNHADSQPSASFRDGDRGIAFKCHKECESRAVAEAFAAKLGLRVADFFHRNGDSAGRRAAPRIVATYDYTDERGELLSQAVRLEPKGFYQRRPDGHDGWIKSIEGVRLVPYRLHELAEARRVFIVEGEKDADRLWSLGLPATTNAMGAGKWRAEHTDALVRAAVEDVVIIPDNDRAGAQHAERVATSCRTAGLRVRIVQLTGLPPVRERHGEDVSDWLDGGHDAAQLVALAEAAPLHADAEAPAATSALPPWPLYDAADEWEFAPTTFLVDQILPALGIVWWGGMPKRFKSLFLLYVCLAIATEREQVGGHFTIRQRPRILYVAWLHDVCRREAITLLVLDTWTALSPTADPLGAKDQAALAAVVVQLAEDIGGAVVVVDHSRKNRPEGQVLSSADIFGPPQKWAAAEHIVMLGSTDDRHRIEAFVESKDGDGGRFFLDVSARGSGAEKFTYGGSVEQLANDQRAIGDANRQAVLETLQRNTAPLSRGEIVALIEADGRKLSADTIQRHAAALEAGGHVRRFGKGRATRYSAMSESPQGPFAAIAVQQGAANE